MSFEGSAESVTRRRKEKFGAVLGISSGNVPAYSCNYSFLALMSMGCRGDWKHYHEGIFTGVKWQCVEFARRWLLINKGYTFADIPMAYDIMDLTAVQVQVGGRKGESLPLWACKNGGRVPPEPGAMIIWDRRYGGTGHVAIVTEASAARVRVAEQNFDDRAWAAGADHSRELRATLGGDGGYTVHDAFPILGWMLQREHDPRLL